jgi:hypothetical protein
VSERKRWGKAGQRLDPAEAQRRRTAILARKHQAEASHERDMAKGRRKWAAGLVVPWRITTALNMADLYGPEVDVACGAEEPDVDRWEAGELYPTWEQLCLLAGLTGCTPRFFTMFDAEPLPATSTSLRFHVPAEDLPEYESVLRFPEHVWRPVVERAEVSS